MNKKELQVEMVRFGDNGDSLAKALGITRSTLSRKMNGISDFTYNEMSIIIHRYNLSGERIKEIFFADGLS